MDNNGNGELESESRGGRIVECFSSSNSVTIPPLYEHWNETNSSIDGSWVPLDSAAQNVETAACQTSLGQLDNFSYTDLLRSQVTSGMPQFVHFQSDYGFGNGSFSEMDNFFIHQRCGPIANFGSSSNYCQRGNGNGTEKVSNSESVPENYTQVQVRSKVFDEDSMWSSPDGKKRKREDQSQYTQSKNLKTAKEKDQKPDEEKQKSEQKPAADLHVGKQAKESSTSGDASKEDYVHVRAKRGQATNSHSLAERVRREKIRERMKFLQDLVPGCSKITGKAVMLDEIINYVLSLQQQVEFLSMKLATVYPGLNVDRSHILPSDIHCSQGGGAATLGEPDMNSYQKEMVQGALVATQTSNLEPPIMPNVANLWSDELDNANHMGFFPCMAPQNSDSNDCAKVEP
ncbi:hypothetical protein NMG60_11006017 [Bertholletia excelsa]